MTCDPGFQISSTSPVQCVAGSLFSGDLPQCRGKRRIRYLSELSMKFTQSVCKMLDKLVVCNQSVNPYKLQP